MKRIPCATLLILFGAAGPSLGQEPNNSFETATVLSPGVLTATGTLTPGVVNFPDTLLGVRSAPGIITQIDDNGSSLGNGLASGVSGVLTNNGDVFFSVTGVGDNGFTGAHTESGEFEVLVEVFDPTGVPVFAQFLPSRVLEPGEVETFQLDGPDCPGCTYNANIDNTLSPPTGGDLDFFTFTGLPAGAVFSLDSLEQTAGLDTLIFQYNDEGQIITTDVFFDIEGLVPPSGQLTFAVTGANDFNPNIPGPDGAHLEGGQYGLTLTINSADFDDSGAVDGLDLALWQDGFGIDADGDADADGDSDGNDFLLWQRQFGLGATAGSVVGVPEPRSLVAMLLGAAIYVSATARLPLVCSRAPRPA